MHLDSERFIRDLPAKCLNVPEVTREHHFASSWTSFKEMKLCALWNRNYIPGRLRVVARSVVTSGAARDMVQIARESVGRSNIAKISINRPPVNSVNVALALELAETIKEVENSGSVDAIVIKSSIPTIFSAGLDLNDLHQVSRNHLETFWKYVQEMWYNLYSSRLPTVAAINSHCLAAGTILASACDYRIAAKGKYGIGVTAAKVGLVAPPWFLTMLTHLMGQRQTELALQRGRIFTPEDALEIGLVDDICAPEQLETKCREALQPFLEVFQESRTEMKLSLRSDLIKSFQLTRDEDMDRFVSYVLRDSVQTQLGAYITAIKRQIRK